MKVWIDRDICEGNLSSCLSCLLHLVRTGEAEHACIMRHEGNGSKDMMIFMYSESQDREPLVIPKQLVDMIAYEFKDGILAPKIEIEF